MTIPAFLLSCHEATLLIEQRADESLPLKTQAQLWAHLRLCPLCHRYSFQSPFIARQAKAAAETRVPSHLALPVAARQRMQALLDAAR